MLGWIVKVVLFRTVFKRFWWFPVAAVVLQKVLPWEKRNASGTDTRNRRGWLSA